MQTGFMKMLSKLPDSTTIVDWLDMSPFDELVEIDVVNNTCRNIYHVEGKYFVPVFDGSYFDLYRFSVGHMVHPDDLRRYKGLMDPPTLMERLEASETPGLLCSQFRYKLQDGGWRWVEQYVIGGARYGMPEGIARFYVLDVQNKKDRELGKEGGTYFSSELKRDEMTRLLREKAFFDEAKRLLETIEPSKWCIVAIDLDHFKLFNDWYGRVQGDMLLARVGERLADAEAATGGVAGYFGGDDFCIVMPNDANTIESLYADICIEAAELSETIGFRPIFGVSVIERDIAFLDLFDRAKAALHNAMKSFKSDICFYEADMQARSDKAYRVLLDFKDAILNGEFVAYLQPQCRAATGKVIGAEALVRWIKPNGEVVSPADFLPVLEEHGFITDLDCYIWGSVCASVRRWIDAGHQPVPVSVNVSQVDLYTIDVAERFCDFVEEYDIPPSLIKIEITESAFAEDASLVMDVTDRLREAGFLVMMDDFGSGYSSLNMLGSLNVDVLKLDGAFLRLEGDSKRKGVRIVESVINMAKNMALPIVAEGVETIEQLEFLESLGVRYIQGFHFYRPMPLEDFERIAADQSNIDDRGFTTRPNEQMRIRELLDQNVYSDSMLNGILGPVAFYLWHGDDVDIVRFNEQFYEAVGVPDFSDLLYGIQRMVPTREVSDLYQLLDQATKDELNGSQGIITFNKTDGSFARFLLHFYFLGETSEGKRFYASARDVTDIMELQRQMRVLSDCLSNSILFANRRGDTWDYEVVVHGLEERIGMTAEELRNAFKSGAFVERVASGGRERMLGLTHESLPSGRSFSCEISLQGKDGTAIPLRVRADFGRTVDADDAVFVVTLSEL